MRDQIVELANSDPLFTSTEARGKALRRDLLLNPDAFVYQHYRLAPRAEGSFLSQEETYPSSDDEGEEEERKGGNSPAPAATTAAVAASPAPLSPSAGLYNRSPSPDERDSKRQRR